MVFNTKGKFVYFDQEFDEFDETLAARVLVWSNETDKSGLTKRKFQVCKYSDCPFTDFVEDDTTCKQLKIHQELYHAFNATRKKPESTSLTFVQLFGRICAMASDRYTVIVTKHYRKLQYLKASKANGFSGQRHQTAAIRK